MSETTEEYREMVYGGYATDGEKVTDPPKADNTQMYGGWWSGWDAPPDPPVPDLSMFTQEQRTAIGYIARVVAKEIIDSERSILTAYFTPSHKLVTHGWLRDTQNALQVQIEYLRYELLKMQQPWWKRWFR